MATWPSNNSHKPSLMLSYCTLAYDGLRRRNQDHLIKATHMTDVQGEPDNDFDFDFDTMETTSFQPLQYHK